MLLRPWPWSKTANVCLTHSIFSKEVEEKNMIYNWESQRWLSKVSSTNSSGWMRLMYECWPEHFCRLISIMHYVSKLWLREFQIHSYYPIILHIRYRDVKINLIKINPYNCCWQNLLIFVICLLMLTLLSTHCLFTVDLSIGMTISPRQWLTATSHTAGLIV